MSITTEQFTGAPDGALMGKPSGALCVQTLQTLGRGEVMAGGEKRPRADS